MKIHHVWKLSVVCLIALACLSGMTGCTPGGSSGSGGGGGGGTGDQPQLVTLQATDPVCPVSGAPNVWNVFSNNLAPIVFPFSYLTAFCDLRSNPFLIFTNLQVQLQITTTNAGIDHYTWEIIPPTDATLAGTFLLRGSDTLIVTGGTRYVAQTSGNTITYITPIVGQVFGLDLPVTVAVIATAWTSDGRFTSGTFALNLERPGDVTVRHSGLSSSSQPSHANPNLVADFYQLKGLDTVFIAIAATNGNCTYIYDSGLTNTQNQCDNSGLGYTLLSSDLLQYRPYYVEVTPNANNILGDYYSIFARDLTSANPGGGFMGPLTSPSNPWNPRSQAGYIYDLSYLAQTNTDVPFYADYYKLTGGATITINSTFTPNPGATAPGGTNGVVSVYLSTNGGPPLLGVSPEPNSQNKYILFLGEIYYLEVASFQPTNGTGFRVVSYTISIDNGAMLPTISPFP
jgi:hypothetical protein